MSTIHMTEYLETKVPLKQVCLHDVVYLYQDHILVQHT